MGSDEPTLNNSAEDLVAAADRSGSFSDIEMVEVSSEPRTVDIHLETPAGHEYIVMLREDIGKARVLYEDYVFDDVSAHRVLDFVGLMERGEVDLSFTRFLGRQLVLRVSLPEGDWVDQRRFANDLSEWEKSVLERP
ncbi:hypothetical protein [Streptomyces sp. FH025]|uniref:hypothetical protein n=1 Tax=Streptomyces sp. FH025 TaxID=2815937 RepID=UPI001A9FDE44|nr:hypothetical protein [Streptomyces sp. FH025]MBO1414658.1 hypothetical protein [Streptomyces sp. FH025]